MSSATDAGELPEALFSEPTGPGGAPPSSPGSSGALATDAATSGEFDCPVCSKSLKNRAGLASHLQTHPDYRPEVAPAADVAEMRPSANGKRKSLFGRKARPRAESPGPAPSRPSLRRVSTAPLTSTIVVALSGGLEKIGQSPLAMYAGFTAPVAGEIVDEAIAGTMVDRLAQPLVAGSEKYQNLGAYIAGFAAVAWASNNPENAEAAYGLFRWSMATVLPLAGKQMVAQAKAERKAAEQMAEIVPELREMGFGEDPIAGLWQMMWARPPRSPEPVPAEEPVVS